MTPSIEGILPCRFVRRGRACLCCAALQCNAWLLALAARATVQHRCSGRAVKAVNGCTTADATARHRNFATNHRLRAKWSPIVGPSALGLVPVRQLPTYEVVYTYMVPILRLNLGCSECVDHSKREVDRCRHHRHIPCGHAECNDERGVDGYCTVYTVLAKCFPDVHT